MPGYIFLLLPWEVTNVEIQILEGQSKAVFCKRQRFCGSCLAVTAISGVNIWDDVLDALMGKAEYLLTLGTGCHLPAPDNNITTAGLKWTTSGLVLCLQQFPVTDAK